MTGPRGMVLLAGLPASLLVGLNACTTLGGNVRGSFSCAAPDGSCAPTATIDDRALAMISGATAPASQDSRVPRRTSTTAMDQLAAPTAARGEERVLRIVFPAYVDADGRLHETAAVRAVVAAGHWQSAALVRDSLAEMVDHADPVVDGAGAADPQLPDPGIVAAARARGDPIAAIKADVDQRLNRRPVAHGGTATPATSGAAAPARPSQPPAAAPAPRTAGPIMRAGNFPPTPVEEQ